MRKELYSYQRIVTGCLLQVNVYVPPEREPVQVWL